MPTIRKQSPRRRRRTKSAVDRIGPIGSDEGDGIKINLYGRSGTGKTTLWATFPKPILAMVCSAGKKPGELKSINTAANRKTIKKVILEKTDDLRELVEYQEREEKFKTIVLDHASGLQDLTLKEILGLESLPPQGSWGMADRGQWGQCALQMKEMLRALLSLDGNVVIVAQEREFNTDAEGTGDLLMPFVASALTPSVVGWLNPACDYICQTFIRQREVEKVVKVGKKSIIKRVKVRGVDYCLRTAPDPVYTTKFRLPKQVELPEAIVDPTFEKLYKLIQQEILRKES